MIAKLRGIVDRLESDSAVIDVVGVGYLVFASARTLSRLVVGEMASLAVETHVREDHIHLFAFADALEQGWFRLLTTVQGVGPKAALAILSVLSPDELAHAIAVGDKAQVARANGVGPKLAGRVVSELKDKVANLMLGAGAKPLSEGAKGKAGDAKAATPPDAVRDAVSALVNLGYGPSEALTAVSHAGAGANVGVEELIRRALGEMGQHDRREHRA